MNSSVIFVYCVGRGICEVSKVHKVLLVDKVEAKTIQPQSTVASSSEVKKRD